MANSLYEVLLTEARLEAPREDVAEAAFVGQLLRNKSRAGRYEPSRKGRTIQPLRATGRPSGAKRVDPGAGAIVDFWGVVRELEDEREIEGIDYEAHAAMAEHQLQLIAQESAKNFKLKKVIIHHRIGFVSAGEASLFLQVKAGHRAAAFAASKWIVDELKKRVPIWKRPRFKIDPTSPRLRRGKPASPRRGRGKQREPAISLPK
jgi:molybdopterin synthase catalytic subunit